MMEGNPYETAVCNYCGSASSHTIFRYGATGVVRCTNCRLVYASPRLREPLMQEIYRKSDYFRDVLQTSDDVLDQRETLNDVMRERILDRLGRPSPGGHLLDLGCGMGRFMQLAQHRGWRVEGWEVSEFAAQFAGECLSLNVRTGPMDLARIPPELFEAVALIDVFDHVYSPAGTLQEVHRILKPGGRVAMTMLNFNGLSTHLFGRRNSVLDTSEQGPGHVTFFTATTLRAFLARAGFGSVTLWTGEVYLKNFTNLFRRFFASGRSSVELHRKMRGMLRPSWWALAAYHTVNWILRTIHLGDQITAIAQKSP